MRNGLKLCVIAPPSFGYKQHELMQDIALALGATYFSDKTGNDLSVIKMEDLGHASKVVVGAQSTVVIRGKKGEQELIDERVSQLASSVTASTKKSDRDFIMERIASLKGGIGVIHVGGNTDIEQKELYDRIDDAVCAVRSALEEGIVSGGGKALYDIANKIFDKYVAGKDTDEMSIAAQIMFDAMRAPLFTIMENAWCGEEAVRESAIDGKLDIEGYGMDVKAMEWCYLEQRGIVDPVKVTRSALENAVSVAVTILSTDAIVTMARSYEAKQ
jgi:chaperonin GroEL